MSGARRERIHVGVYVDDLAVVYSHDDEHSLYHSFIAALESLWKVEDEGELTDLYLALSSRAVTTTSS